MGKNQREFFYCYSNDLFYFLKYIKGIDYICTGLHVHSKKQFWQFRNGEEITQALKEYETFPLHEVKGKKLKIINSWKKS